MAAYRDATAFDHPTVLVTSDGDDWAAYLSGVPSSRVDAVGTVVRYTLVLDGPCGMADAACVAAVAGAWLDDVAAGTATGPAAGSARRSTPGSRRDVERWLAGRASEPPRSDGPRAGRRAWRASRPRRVPAADVPATGSAPSLPPAPGPRSPRASPRSSTAYLGGPCC